MGPLLFSITLRIWFLYYDLKYAEAVLSHEWWQILDSDDKNWFIENRNKYGILSPRMYKIIAMFMSIYVILMFIGAFNHEVTPKIHEVTTTFVGITSWIADAILFCKMPKHYDLFAIRKEINRWTIWLFVIGSYFIVTAAMGLEDKYPFFLWMHGFVYIIETCGFISFSTLYPKHQMRLSDKKSATSQPNIEMSMSGSNTASIDTLSKTTSKSSPDTEFMWYSWINLCEDDTNFNTFMRQLIKEVQIYARFALLYR